MNIALSDIEFDLPEELIALNPSEKRENCRLLISNPVQNVLKDAYFFDILEYFNAGDILVLNDTKVDKSRIYGKRKSGGQHEVVLISSTDLLCWEVLASKSRKLNEGELIFFTDSLWAKVIENKGGGKLFLEFNHELNENVLDQIAELPLPPYIRRKREYSSLDDLNYQTVYAKHAGSKAAPTAGLHFTKELLSKLEAKGVLIVFVQLYVSLGTFEPVKTENVLEHKMHSETYYISPKSAEILNNALKNKQKITAVGTTVVRTLESAFKNGRIQAGKNSTNIFIYPGYSFNVVSALVTNFHTPGSTLLLLVMAMMGKNFTYKAYNYAISNHYKFFSYGDAMYISGFNKQ